MLLYSLVAGQSFESTPNRITWEATGLSLVVGRGHLTNPFRPS